MIRLIGFLLLVAGGIFTWLGAQDGIVTWKRLSLAEDVTGEIDRYDVAPAGTTGYVPVVSFRAADGNLIETRLPPIDRPDQAVGTPVRLIHPPGRPDLAESGDMIALWGPAAIPVGGGLIGAILGLGLMTTRRRRPEEMPKVPFLIRFPLLLAGLGLVAVAWVRYEAVVETLDHFPRARGEVVALNSDLPVVRYTTGDGVSVDYVDRTVAPGSFSPGQRVTVGYSRANPAGARIEKFWEIWAAPAVWGTIAGFVLMAALYVSSIKRGKAAAPPPPEPVAVSIPEAELPRATVPPAPRERQEPTFNRPA